jgi:hypothetical protein
MDDAAVGCSPDAHASDWPKLRALMGRATLAVGEADGAHSRGGGRTLFRVTGAITSRRKHGGYGCPSWARLEKPLSLSTTDAAGPMNIQLMLSRDSYDSALSDARFDAAIALGTRVGSFVAVSGYHDYQHDRPGQLTLVVVSLDLVRADPDPAAVRRVRADARFTRRVHS